MGKACSTIMYIQNISPHRDLGFKTLEKDFTGKNPKVGHFGIFKCPNDSLTLEEISAQNGPPKMN